MPAVQAAPVTGADERWAQAQALLDGVAPEAARRRLRRGQRQLLIGCAVALLVAFGIMLTVLAWSGDGPGDDSDDSDDEALWRTVAGLVLMLAGLGIAAPSAFRLLRDVRLREQWRTPLLALDLAQRRDLARQVSGRIPADPAHLPLARHLAESLVRQSPPPRMLLGLLIMVTGQSINSWSLWSVVALLGLGLAWQAALRSTRHARAFLDAHPEPPA